MTNHMPLRFPLSVAFAFGLVVCATAAQAENCAKQLPSLLDRSLIVVAGKITKVGPAPGFWSDVLPAIQDVQYDVLGVFKGKDPGKQITVSYKVVNGSRLVQKHPPGLSAKFFAEGKELILFLHTVSQDINDECAAQVRTPELENQIKSLQKTN
jgi:hypothetical protein